MGKKRHTSVHKQHGITVTRLIARDGPACAICGQAVDRRLRDPHPASPTLDHVIPTSRGGTSNLDNLRLAHRRCNNDRGNAPVVDEQDPNIKPTAAEFTQREQAAWRAEWALCNKKPLPCGVVVRFGNEQYACRCAACQAWQAACRRCPPHLAPPLPPPGNARERWDAPRVAQYVEQLAEYIAQPVRST